jgi:nicotinate-nucleotide--dimethylbenzimidazole phosphoribosyltransferase
MTGLTSIPELYAVCRNLPIGDTTAATAVKERQAQLTKPLGSLGRLEELVAWLAQWQGRNPPRLDAVDVLIFAGTHGVTGQGVSAYPAEVTGQMVANFVAGGAAINQIARVAHAKLRVEALSLEQPTADFTLQPAMDEPEFLAAVRSGYAAVSPASDLLCLGEMGIGNTTAAAALAAALFGGDGKRWAGRGTGIDDNGLVRKRGAIDKALLRHEPTLGDPLRAAAAFGGRELAAIFGAVLAARHRQVPVLLDGFVCCAAAAPLKRLNADGLSHTLAAHVSAEPGHRILLNELGLVPLLDLDMRLGEASGAALAVPLLRAALACHTGMATFSEARLSGISI